MALWVVSPQSPASPAFLTSPVGSARGDLDHLVKYRSAGEEQEFSPLFPRSVAEPRLLLVHVYITDVASMI